MDDFSSTPPTSPLAAWLSQLRHWWNDLGRERNLQLWKVRGITGRTKLKLCQLGNYSNVVIILHFVKFRTFVTSAEHLRDYAITENIFSCLW